MSTAGEEGTSRGVKLPPGWRCWVEMLEEGVGGLIIEVIEAKAGETVIGEVLMCISGWAGGGFCSHCVSRVVVNLVRWDGCGHA